MTIRSENEIAGMVAKAARGAGVPLGHAEDLGGSAKWLAGALGPMLEAIENAATAQARQTHCAALGGVAQASDIAAGQADFAAVDDFDVPAVVRALVMYNADLHGVTLRADGAARLGEATEIRDDIASTIGRYDVEDAVWERLNSWAARTYVRATAASRLAGAGAGLTDND